MALENERKYFEANRKQLLKEHEGQFVLIKGEEVVGAFPDALTAYSVGLGKFGVEPFLVHQVLEEEPVAFLPLLSFVPTRANSASPGGE